MKDAIDIDGNGERLADIVLYEFESWIGEEMIDVFTMDRDEIVDAYHLMALGDQPVAKMRADETCRSRDNVTHALHPKRVPALSATRIHIHYTEG